MQKLYKYILTVCAAAIVFSCEETINIDTSSTDSKVVIEGLVTNVAGGSYVKLSRSRNFYDNGQTNRISNAQVTVNSSTGEQIVFVHNPSGGTDSLGYYFPNPNFSGSIGTSYTLNVEVDGQTYTGIDEMLPVTSIDSMVVRVDEGQLEDPDDPGRIYAVFMFATEPQDRIDHYLFKFYRNGELLLDWPTDIYVFDDETLGESIDDVEIAGYYAEGDIVKAEIYSLTREGFIYYSDLATLLNNDGGMFSPPPANPRSNLSNGAMGYFQASAVDAMEITVSPEGN